MSVQIPGAPSAAKGTEDVARLVELRSKAGPGRAQRTGAQGGRLVHAGIALLAGNVVAAFGIAVFAGFDPVGAVRALVGALSG